jgi:hypothetical protein
MACPAVTVAAGGYVGTAPGVVEDGGMGDVALSRRAGQHDGVRRVVRIDGNLVLPTTLVFQAMVATAFCVQVATALL